MTQTKSNSLRRPTLHHVSLAVFGLALAMSGCQRAPGQPDPANRPLPENEVLGFAALFGRHCAGCHGSKGLLGPAPPLNDPIFLAIVPDEELLRVITQGRHGTPMPAFARETGGALSAAQIRALAEGIKPHWRTNAAPPTAPPYLTPAAGPEASPAELQRGTFVFNRACVDCHGENGRGNGPDTTPGAINDPAFLALISDQALRRLIITGRPDLGMPNFSQTDGRDGDFKPLTSAEIDDLVALLAHWRKGGDRSARQTRTQPPHSWPTIAFDPGPVDTALSKD